jgi:hypothetical protein
MTTGAKTELSAFVIQQETYRLIPANNQTRINVCIAVSGIPSFKKL